MRQWQRVARPAPRAGIARSRETAPPRRARTPGVLRRKTVGLAIAAAAALALAPYTSHADQAYWNGGAGANWGAGGTPTPTNWDTDVSSGIDYGAQPGSSTDVYFSTTTPTPANLSNNLGATYNINSLNFLSTDATGTIAAGTGGALTLNAGINDASTAAQTVTVGITLGGIQTWKNTGTALLTTGAVANGGFALTTQTAGTGIMTIGALSGSGGLISTGTGTLTLSAANPSFTGPITLNNIGTTTPNILILGNASALGGTSGLTVNGLALAGSTGNEVELGTNITVTGQTITMNATATGGQRAALGGAASGIETWAGNVYLTNSVDVQLYSNGGTMNIGSSSSNTITSDGNTSAAIALRGGGNGTINSTITLPTTVGLGKTDAGSWTIKSSGNTWGNTGISQGSIILGTSGALPATTALSVGQASSPGTLNLNGFNQTVASITDVTATGISTITSSTSATLTVNNSGADTFGSHNALITGTGLALTKTNTGTLTLATADTYSGVTTITGGTLALGSAGTIANTVKIDVQSSGTYDTSAQTSAYPLGASQTLMGTGQVKAPTAGMTSNGTIAPGETSAGTLTISGPVALANPSAASFFLNTSGVAGGSSGDSLLAITTGSAAGNLTLNPGLTVNVTPGAGFTTGIYQLIDYNGTLTDNSSGFNGWTSPQLNALGDTYQFGFDTDNGVNAVDLDVTSVPEPASLSLLGLGAALLLVRRRRNALP